MQASSQQCFFFVFHRRYMFDSHQDDPNYNPLPEDRPGGFDWGQGQALGEDNAVPNQQWLVSAVPWTFSCVYLTTELLQQVACDQAASPLTTSRWSRCDTASCCPHNAGKLPRIPLYRLRGILYGLRCSSFCQVPLPVWGGWVSVSVLTYLGKG